MRKVPESRRRKGFQRSELELREGTHGGDQGAHPIPQVGVLACNSSSSNSGTLSGLAAARVAREFEEVGILSLPALANGVARQVRLLKRMHQIVVVDGCKNACATKIIERLGVAPGQILNLEKDLSIMKLGPFTTFRYDSRDLERVVIALREIVVKMTLPK